MERAATINLNSKTKVKQSRIYFGHEFCQKLIPSLEEARVIFFDQNFKGKSFSLLTPIITDPGFKKINRLAKEIVNHQIDCEIVVNDFGVLNFIHRNFPSIKLVIGRILSTHFLPLDSKTYVKNANLLDFIHQHYHVDRIEIDNRGPDFEIDVPFSLSFLRLSIYYPYVVTAASRRCPYSHATGNDHRFEEFTCHHECQKIKEKFSFEYPWMKEKQYLRDNANFIKHDHLSKSISETTNIDRIVDDSSFFER